MAEHTRRKFKYTLQYFYPLEQTVPFSSDGRHAFVFPFAVIPALVSLVYLRHFHLIVADRRATARTPALSALSQRKQMPLPTSCNLNDPNELGDGGLSSSGSAPPRTAAGQKCCASFFWLLAARVRVSGGSHCALSQYLPFRVSAPIRYGWYCGW